jgi:hypothetical protein
VPQVAAVDLYRQGLGGDDVELVLWVLVPRFLFPEKPVITRGGTDFNAKITGSEASSTGVGWFISGFYNLGWFGVAAVSMVGGILMSLYAAVSRAILRCGSMFLLPIVLLGSFTAFRVDGNFASDVWGSFAMVMVPLLCVAFVVRPQSAVAMGRHA